MTRSLKMLAPALAVAFAMGAMLASTASAEGQWTAEAYPAHIDVSSISGKTSTFTGIGMAVECEPALTGVIAAATPKITLTPTFAGCFQNGIRESTTTVNECDFELRSPTEVSSDKWTLAVDLKCPSEKKIEVHVYNQETPEKHLSTYCTFTSTPAENIGNLVATNVTGAKPARDVELTGSLELKTLTHGTCTSGLTINYVTTLDASWTVTSTSGEGGTAGVEID
jgi:hypothetical protein